MATIQYWYHHGAARKLTPNSSTATMDGRRQRGCMQWKPPSVPFGFNIIMCFNIFWSAGFSALGALMTMWVLQKTTNKQLAVGFFYFFLMEFLQVIQYLFIADSLDSPICGTTINQVLTVLGFIHICGQPLFIHLMNEALLPAVAADADVATKEKAARMRSQYGVVKRMGVLGGFLLFLRWPLSYVAGWNTHPHGVPSTEWLRGDHLCTYKTNVMVHLGWSVPMADPTYNIMGTGIHMFCMFAPFLLVSDSGWSFPGMFTKGMFAQGVICYLTGPFFASMLTSNQQEQASVWCLFSIAQIFIMIVRVRGFVMKNYGKHKRVGSASPSKSKSLESEGVTAVSSKKSGKAEKTN